MPSKELNANEIAALLEFDAKPTTGYPPPNQFGPVRWYDKEMRCANKSSRFGKGCGSPTYLKIRSIPLCTVHAIQELNRLINELLGGPIPDNPSPESGVYQANFTIVPTGGEDGSDS